MSLTELCDCLMGEDVPTPPSHAHCDEAFGNSMGYTHHCSLQHLQDEVSRVQGSCGRSCSSYPVCTAKGLQSDSGAGSFIAQVTHGRRQNSGRGRLRVHRQAAKGPLPIQHPAGDLGPREDPAAEGGQGPVHFRPALNDGDQGGGEGWRCDEQLHWYGLYDNPEGEQANPDSGSNKMPAISAIMSAVREMLAREYRANPVAVDATMGVEAANVIDQISHRDWPPVISTPPRRPALCAEEGRQPDRILRTATTKISFGAICRCAGGR